MVRANQGGSVLSFLIIGGVLVALLIGGVYFVRNQANGSVAQATTDQQKKSDMPEQAAPAKTDDKDKKAEDKKATETKPDTSKKEAPAPSPAPRPAELPQTGPAETVAAMMGVSLLVGAATAYYRSRSQRLAL
jgi:LPXTG-motif cell wall-anchored protein